MATPYKLKRSAVTGKSPTLADLEKGELALNFYDGNLYAERDGDGDVMGGVGIGTTVANLTPWKEVTNKDEIQYSGVVSATTYHGDQIIGTPSGGSFRAGAYTPDKLDKTKDSIDELNYILGKLVPTQPDNIGGASITLSGLNGGGGNGETSGYFCQGFTPTNNTNDAAPNQTGSTSYSRNTDSTISSNAITDYGPGDSGTLTGYVNTVGVGTTTFNVSFGIYAAGLNSNVTSDQIRVTNNTDAADSLRNTGISSLFYEVYDVAFLNAACPDGYNEAYFTHGSNTTNSVYWYEDPSTVGAPVISFSAVTPPPVGTAVTAWSSGVPHYTQSSNNTFTYVVTVENASGDMYKQSRLLKSETSGQTAGFTNPGHKNYDAFAGGTIPPARNYGVGTGVTCLISQYPTNIHTTVLNTANHFTRWDCDTTYGHHLDQRLNYDKNVNIMGTTADYTNNVDEDAIECTVGSLTGGSATRVNAGATGDNPTPVYTAWNAATSPPAVYEAIVRGGDLTHDVTDYTNAVWLPTGGPDLSSGRSGNQYFQCQFIQASISQFQISYTGSLAGCWVCMPDNSAWTTGLSDTNGWADMFNEYAGSGTPRNDDPGCASGGVMDTNGGTFICTFGEESSSNDSNNRILVRFKLTSGQSISDISFSDT